MTKWWLAVVVALVVKRFGTAI